MYSMYQRIILNETNAVREVPNHKCDLNVRESYISSHIEDGMFVELRRRFRQFVTISSEHPQTQKLFHSVFQIETQVRKHLINHYYVVHPMSMANYYRNIFMIFVYLFSLMLIPLEVSVTYNLNDHFKYLKLTLDILCYIDVIFCFCCGFYNHKMQKVVMQPKSIAKHYLLTYFVPDVVSSVPINFLLYYFNEEEEYRPYKLILLLKLFRLQTALDNLEYLIPVQKYYSIASSLIQFLIVLIYSMAISYITEVLLAQNPFFDEEENELFINYVLKLTTLYSGLLFQVDHGLVYNKSVFDMWLLIFWALGGLAIKFIMLCKIMQIYRRYNASTKKTKSNLQEFKIYASYKGLSPELKRKIKTFMIFQAQTDIMLETSIWESLSKNLRHEIMLNNCQTFVEKLDFFKDLPTHAMLRIVNKLHSEIFLTGDIIFQAGVAGSTMYFIYFGKVAVYTADNQEICHLGEGAHFGEIALLINTPRTATVVAITECKLYRLSRRDFLEALDPFPDLKNRIWKLASDRLEKSKLTSADDNASVITPT